MSMPSTLSVEARLARHAAYVELSARAAAAPDRAALYEVVSTYLPKVLGVPRGSLALLGTDAQQGQFTVIALGGDGSVMRQGAWIPLEGTAIARACEDEQPVSTLAFPRDAFADWRMLHAKSGLAQFVICPLMTREGPIGTLNLGLPEDVPIEAADLRTAEQFAIAIAGNLYLQNLNERLEQSLDALSQAQDQLVLRQKQAALGNLVSGFAHEVNTPLGVARTAVSMMSSSVGKARAILDGNAVSKRALLEALDAIDNRAELAESNLARATRLLRSIKGISADTAAGPSIERVDLRALLLDTVESLEPMLEPLRISVAVSGPPVTIGTDAELLRGVITNLIENAAKHAYRESHPNDERSLRPVTVFLEPAEPNTAYGVTLHVEDRGCGIPEALRTKVFEPFYTTARGRGGTGLGLYLVHRTVVDTLGGDLAIDATHTQGTRFTIRLPDAIERRSGSFATVEEGEW
jgi:signal transduction histidine kinase